MSKNIKYSDNVDSWAKKYQQFSDQIQQKFFLDLVSGNEKKSGLMILDLGY